MTTEFRPAAHVRNAAKYYDRTVQEWHAATFPKSFSAIDLDLAGFCPRCARPLYLIEAAETEHKPTRVLRTLGLLTATPSLLIVHADHRISKAKRIDKPETGEWRTESELAEYIHKLRRLHECES